VRHVYLLTPVMRKIRLITDADSVTFSAYVIAKYVTPYGPNTKIATTNGCCRPIPTSIRKPIAAPIIAASQSFAT
jgi:hypothetical protein